MELDVFKMIKESCDLLEVFHDIVKGVKKRLKLVRHLASIIINLNKTS
jgi:hypothetical protein